MSNICKCSMFFHYSVEVAVLAPQPDKTSTLCIPYKYFIYIYFSSSRLCKKNLLSELNKTNKITGNKVLSNIRCYHIVCCYVFWCLFLLHFRVPVVPLFYLLVDVFPSVIVCYPDLISVNRFITFEQRYTTVAINIFRQVSLTNYNL